MSRFAILLDTPARLIASGEELMIEHYREMGLPGVLSLDVGALGMAYTAGTLFPFALREDGELVGYAIVTASPTLFNKHLRRAWCEAIYIKAERRGEGLARSLAEHVEGFMKAWGVRHVSYTVSPEPILRGDAETAKVGQILAGLGYAHDGEVWSKRLEG